VAGQRVRELENLIQRLIVTTAEMRLPASDLRLVCWLKALPRRRQFCSLRTAPTLNQQIRQIETGIVKHSVAANNGQQDRGRTTLESRYSTDEISLPQELALACSGENLP